VNNTDADIQVQYCLKCTIEYNTAWHTADFRYAAHASLIFGPFRYGWSSDFTGSNISYNTVRCPHIAGYNSCGVGFEIGQDRWFDQETQEITNGWFSGNSVADAAVGFEIASGASNGVYDNSVTYNATPASLCIWNFATNIDSWQAPMAFNVSPQSNSNDRWAGVSDVSVVSQLPNVAGHCGQPLDVE
jgi:hypothetical protein